MIAETRKQEGKYEAYFADIRSLCSLIPSMSVEEVKELHIDSLRTYLKYLAKMIKQLLCSSTTLSTKFSWKLQRAIYPLEARKAKSLYSMGESREIREAPMKVLDDLNICEVRAKLRVEASTKGVLTPMQEEGKRWWYKKRVKYLKIIQGAFKKSLGFIIHNTSLEHSLALLYVGDKYIIEMHGAADIVLLTSLKCYYTGNEIYVPLVLLFEFTLFKDALKVVKTRLEAYATALYGIYGYPVIPVLAIIEDEEAGKGKLYILYKESLFSITLTKKLKRLEKIIANSVKPKRASKEICISCDIELRRKCPFYH